LVEIDECAIGPQALSDLFPGNYFSRLLEQHGKDLKRLVLQMDSEVPFIQFTTGKVNVEKAETKTRAAAGRGLHRVTSSRDVLESIAGLLSKDLSSFRTTAKSKAGKWFSVQPKFSGGPVDQTALKRRTCPKQAFRSSRSWRIWSTTPERHGGRDF
jgi:hypothetical protein